MIGIGRCLLLCHFHIGFLSRGDLLRHISSLHPNLVSVLLNRFARQEICHNEDLYRATLRHAVERSRMTQPCASLEGPSQLSSCPGKGRGEASFPFGPHHILVLHVANSSKQKKSHELFN